MAAAAAYALRRRPLVSVPAALVAVALLLLSLSGALPPDRDDPGETTALITERAGGIPGGGADDDDKAAALVTQAEQVLDRGDAENAARFFEEARTLYHRLGNVRGEADAVFGLGRMEHMTGQSDGARAGYEEALTLYRRAADIHAEARVLAARGDLEKDTFNWNDAAKFYREARELWVRAPEPKSTKHVVLLISEMQGTPGNDLESRALLQQAAAIFEAIGDTEARGDVEALTAALNWSVGLAGAAYIGYGIAEELYGRVGAGAKSAESALALARACIHLGYNVAAGEALTRSTSFFARNNNTVGTARADLVRGDIERLQGRLELALAAYASAAATLPRDSRAEIADALLSLGQIEWFLGVSNGAGGSFEKSADLYRAAGQVAGEAASRLELGTVAMFSGDLVAAKDMLDGALDLYRAAGDDQGEARALLARGDLYFTDGRYDPARAAFQSSAALFEKSRVPFGQLLAALGLSDIARSNGDATAVAEAYRTADGIMETMEDPVAEANRFLGLPPVGFLVAVPASELPDDAQDIDLDGILDPDVANAQNLQTYPDQNAEARSLAADALSRVESIQQR